MAKLRPTLAAEFDEFLDALEHRNDFTLGRGKYRELQEKLDSISEPPRVKPVSKAPNADSYLTGLWAQANERYERVANAWSSVIADPLNALTHSSLFDVTESRTAAFIEAYGEAQDMRSIFGSAIPTEDRLERFGKLMRRVEELWAVAYDYAERKSYLWLPPAERKQAERADKFLRLAGNAGATVEERARAAEQAAKALREIYSIRLPERVHGELAQISARALNSGS